MTPFGAAIELYLAKRSADALDQLRGVPTEDLNRWRPAAVAGEVNTFYALATHLVGSGEYWVLRAAGGRPLARDRDAEFRATGDLADLDARYARWLSAAREVLAALTEADLARIPDLPDQRAGGSELGLTVAGCLVHAVEHTALHLGHLQIQRQIWDAERGTRNE